MHLQRGILQRSGAWAWGQVGDDIMNDDIMNNDIMNNDVMNNDVMNHHSCLTNLFSRSATGHVRPVCDLARTRSHVEDVATLTGLGVGLSLLAVFIWFTLRLFSKARNVETR